MVRSSLSLLHLALVFIILIRSAGTPQEPTMPKQTLGDRMELGCDTRQKEVTLQTQVFSTLESF
jgi:hypothetical protein